MIQFRLLLSLTKPRIFLAIGLTAWLGFFLRNDFFAHPFLDSVLIFCATVLASSSGAVFNHYFERNTDALMTRTQNRPLVTAGPAVLGQALVFGLLLLAVAMLISYQAFGWGPAFWLLMGWVNYVVFYTLIFKHNSLWNVTVGSFASSFAVLAGDTAYTGEVSLKGFILAVLLFFWNPAHFWNLNVLYQDQYEAAKIPMLAAKFGQHGLVVLRQPGDDLPRWRADDRPGLFCPEL